MDGILTHENMIKSFFGGGREFKLRSHYTLTRMAIINKSLTIPSVSGMCSHWSFHLLLVGMENGENQFYDFLKMLKIKVLCDGVIPLLDIYQIKTYIHSNICTQTFIATLFMIAPN